MHTLFIRKHIAICRILTLSLFGLSTFGCESQSPIDKVPEEQRDVEALIIFDGNPAVDGCGWLILHDQNFHAPVNLDSAFMTDSLKVVLTYSFLESNRLCGWRDPGYREIEILEIKKQ